MAVSLVGQIKIVSSADDSGFKAADKDLLKLQKDADKLAEELDKLGDVTAEVSAEKMANLRVALASIEQQAKESGVEIQGLEKAEKALGDATQKLVRNKIAAGKLQRAVDIDVRRGMDGAQQSQKAMNDLFGQGATKAEGLARGFGVVGAAAAGGFAMGLRIAEKAGLDTRAMMDGLDSAAASLSKGLVAFIGNIRATYEAQGQLDAKLKSTPGRAVSLLEAAKALGVELKGNEEKARRYQQIIQSGVDKAADPVNIEKKNKALEEGLRLRKEELSILGETPARIQAVRAAEIALASAETNGAEKVVALKRTYHLEDVARAQKLAAVEKAEAEKAEKARFDAKERIRANNEAVEASIQATTAATFAAEAEDADDAAVRRQQAKLRIEANNAKVDDAIAGASQSRVESEVAWEQMGADQKSQAYANAAGSMLGVAEQAFGESKELAIAKAVMETWSSAQSSYNAMSGLFPAPAWGVSAAALAVAAGFKNVQRISSTKSRSKGAAPSGIGGAGGKAPSFDDPTNDAAALYAGAASARDVAGHFGNGFRKQLLAGTAHMSAGNTAPAMMDSLGGRGGGTTIVVERAYGTVDEPFVRKLTRDQSKYQAVKESRILKGRDRVRR